MSKLSIKGTEITVFTANKDDYISLTDIAKYRSSDTPADIVKNWLRSRNTIELLGLWEKLHNESLEPTANLRSIFRPCLLAAAQFSRYA